MKRFRVISWICDSTTAEWFSTLDEVRAYILKDQDNDIDWDEEAEFGIDQYEILEVVRDIDARELMK